MFIRHSLCYYFYLTSMFVSDVLLEEQVPKLLSVSVTKEEGLYVKWDQVEYNSSDPIIGYKIKIWEVKEKVDRMFKLINADEIPGLVTRNEAEEVFDKDNIPSGNPRIFKVDYNSDTLEISYIKPDVLQEVRVQTYWANKDGDYSEPWRLKVLKMFGRNAVGHRHMGKCILTVSSNIKLTGGVYPHIYNSYL